MVCEECARESGPDERGWVAVPLDERADGGELLIIVYCPAAPDASSARPDCW
jgi:hypothetical protein